MPSTIWKLALAILPLMASLAAAASPGPALQPVTVQPSDGQLVCGTSGTFSQLPGHSDLSVGRGFWAGTLDSCHIGLHNPTRFLAIFKMNWQLYLLVLDMHLITPPAKTRSGTDLHSAYDPYVALYNGQLWIAFECNVPGTVGSCVVPLAPHLQYVDLSRLTVVAERVLGPHGANGQIVSLISASAPTLLSHDGEFFLYWQIDYFDNQLPENRMITRGIQMQEDSQGRMLGVGGWRLEVGSGGHPVRTNDQHLTSLVHDVSHNDNTKDHVAAMSNLAAARGRIVEIASVGGTAGQQVCRSPHDASIGVLENRHFSCQGPT